MPTVTIKPAEPVERIVLLELSETEAQALIELSQFVGGPFTGRRRHIIAITDALFNTLKPIELLGNMTGFVYIDSEFVR